uniref:Secreted protein n=1 Tax=Anguilla anguilla TaxID=7936 RepID=A0A0E9W788_ANGAN
MVVYFILFVFVWVRSLSLHAATNCSSRNCCIFQGYHAGMWHIHMSLSWLCLPKRSILINFKLKS